jgi:hypothetical protein
MIFLSISETKASHIRMALSPVLHFDKKCNDRPNFLVLNILLKNSELFHLNSPRNHFSNYFKHNPLESRTNIRNLVKNVNIGKLFQK